MNNFPIGSLVSLVWICLSGPNVPDVPRIEVAAESPVYVPVTVKVSGGAAKSSSLIEVPGAAWERRLDKHSSEFTGAPAEYLVTAFYVEIDKDGNPSIIKLKAKTKIVGVVPNPGPTPNPDPPPPNPDPPPVTASKIWIVVVEETAQAAANRGAMFGDAALNAYMRSKGHAWRIIDKDVKGADGKPPADVKRFLDDAAGKPFPSIYFVDDKGRVRARGTLQPTETAANLLSTLQKYDGGN